jgi:hypothetical protein
MPPLVLSSLTKHASFAFAAALRVFVDVSGAVLNTDYACCEHWLLRPQQRQMHLSVAATEDATLGDGVQQDALTMSAACPLLPTSSSLATNRHHRKTGCRPRQHVCPYMPRWHVYWTSATYARHTPLAYNPQIVYIVLIVAAPHPIRSPP